MGRKKCEIVRQFFEVTPCGRSLRCSIGDCSSIISDHSTNLQKHLEINHPSEFRLVMIEKIDHKRMSEDGAMNRTSKKSRHDLMHACVRLTTIHGRPFSLIDDEAFQDILQMLPQHSKTDAGNINAHKVRDAVSIEAANVRDKIKEELKDALISLKVDAATCMGRSFLAINAQFIKHQKVSLRTLGVIELFKSHTSENLKTTILNTCLKFDISSKQIYTITVDNAANMVKTVNILNEEERGENEEETEIMGTELPLLINSDSCESYATEFTREVDFTTYVIRCAAHTLQLAVCDLLKQKEITEIVNKARFVVRKLRTPILKSALSAMCSKNAILDCTTRWNSTLDMLERLVELKSYCDQITDNDLILADETWEKISDLINTLKPDRTATKRMQSEQLLMGELYEIWKRCFIDTSTLNTTFSIDLVNSMKNREKMLFENEVVLSGIFMDPRYNVILTEAQIDIVKTCLLKTFRRIKTIKSLTNVSGISTENIQVVEETDVQEDEFEKLLKCAEAKRARCRPEINLFKIIDTEIEEYLKESRVTKSINVLSYWHSRKSIAPQLYELSKVILGVPATQVSVERLFSGLKFILNNYRTNMKSQLIDDILCIRLNLNK